MASADTVTSEDKAAQGKATIEDKAALPTQDKATPNIEHEATPNIENKVTSNIENEVEATPTQTSSTPNYTSSEEPSCTSSVLVTSTGVVVWQVRQPPKAETWLDMQPSHCQLVKKQNQEYLAGTGPACSSRLLLPKAIAFVIFDFQNMH